MSFNLMNVVLLKHHSSSSSSPPSHKKVQVALLTIFDKVAFNEHVAVVFAFRPPVPSNEIIKTALSKVLVHFPHLAGRYTVDKKGHHFIELNNAGARLIETSMPSPLADHLPFNPSNDLSHLYPPVEGVDELLQIQLNRYACGGLIVGATNHHRVADGTSMSCFFHAWASIVRGLELDTLPYHGRASIFVPRNPLHVEYDHLSLEFKKPDLPNNIPVPSDSLQKIVTHFSSDFIQTLKSKVIKENSIPYSTFECLISHIWKKVTQARGLNHKQFTELRISVDGRARIQPPIPIEYFGNLVLFAYPRLRVDDILTNSYSYVANTIHKAVANIDSKFFQSFIDFGELCNKDNEELENTHPWEIICPNLEVDSCLRFNFHDLDFGGGPCLFFHPDIPVEGVVMLFPSSKHGEDGIDVVMSLFCQHAQLFKQISHLVE